MSTSCVSRLIWTGCIERFYPEGVREVRITRKQLLAICSIVVGVSCAAAVDRWPEFAVPIEMLLYTSFVFVPLFLGMWSERHRRTFWISMLLAAIAHGLLLYAIRSTFPFRTVLIIIPFALLEAVVIFAVMDKVLRDHGIGSSDQLDS